MKILTVGGGTAGLITAIILKRYLNVQLDIVKSEKIGIVGVGEGSTEHFKEFLSFTGIDQYSIIKECGATYKGGILFKDFSSKTYMHSVGFPFDSKVAQYRHLYAHQIAFNNDYFQSRLLWNNQIPAWYLGRVEDLPFNQFHFDTFKLNNFLIKYAKGIGINVYDDEIIDVRLNDRGEIDTVVGEKSVYSYDFYIDSTGFKRVLMEKLGAKWVSFSKYMKMNSAITFPTEETNEYNMWTLAQGLSSGWMFRLPVQGRHGNGYIFNDSYIDMDGAKKEVEALFGKELEIGRVFKFDPGAIEKAWIKNCVAVGLSSLFVEPLEASSIGSSIQQAFLLMHRLSNYDQKTIDVYNKSFDDMVNNIRDFIILHYVSDRRDTNFWQDVANTEIPDSLKEKIELWTHRLPIHEDFNSLSDYIMFQDSNFILVMEGQNLFNKESIKQELLQKPNSVLENAKYLIENEYKVDTTVNTIGHKDFINLVKKHY
jgi:flavin-dependent dehydrogenase